MDLLLDEWSGPGEIEIRDVGPYRCLITFSSEEIRDGAMNDELLLSVFDEVRAHWDIFGSLSRRVWIEVMGMPVKLWCVENFRKIAEQWGKVVRFDDRAEEWKSFSIARVLVNTFQWEFINKWINVKVEDYVFEVMVKEVGAEVYNVQLHPDRDEDDPSTIDNSRSVTPTAAPCAAVTRRSPENTNDGNLNSQSINDALIGESNSDAANNGIASDNVDDGVVTESKRRKTGWEEGDLERMGREYRIGMEMDIGPLSLDWDLMILEAQIQKAVVRRKTNEALVVKECGLKGIREIGPHISDDNNSSNSCWQKREAEMGCGPNNREDNGLQMNDDCMSANSCPFPPGFGSCGMGTHVHREIRDCSIPEVVYETQTAGVK
ncbi:hypothetical protein PIB30_001373, partial [Stylosanthes scabra]|nr:hypothetical protein [Stylosanthes scabra]